jgi:hypothetical protein
MKNKFLLLFLVTTILSFSQIKERELVVGKIKSDSLEVVNITVFNATSNIGAITDVDGKFSINVREKDTLIIQGLAYLSSKYVVQKSDLEKIVLEIYLKTRINELNEIEVSPYTLTGDLNLDSKKIKTYSPDLSGIDYSKLKPNDIRTTRAVNTTNINVLAQTPVNVLVVFGLIGKGIKKLIGSTSNDKKISDSEKVFNKKRLNEVASKPFAEHMKENFSNHFFTNQLKIKNEDIPLFLAFAEVKPEQLVDYLQPENNLKLVEYLISKAEAFKKQ